MAVLLWMIWRFLHGPCNHAAAACCILSHINRLWTDAPTTIGVMWQNQARLVYFILISKYQVAIMPLPLPTAWMTRAATESCQFVLRAGKTIVRSRRETIAATRRLHIDLKRAQIFFFLNRTGSLLGLLQIQCCLFFTPQSTESSSALATSTVSTSPLTSSTGAHFFQALQRTCREG